MRAHVTTYGYGTNSAPGASYSKYKKSCVFAFWGLVAGAAAGCRCRVPLQGAAVTVPCALWILLAGAAAGCCCKVLWGAGCQSVVCALERCGRCAPRFVTVIPQKRLSAAHEYLLLSGVFAGIIVYPMMTKSDGGTTNKLQQICWLQCQLQQFNSSEPSPTSAPWTATNPWPVNVASKENHCCEPWEDTFQFSHPRKHATKIKYKWQQEGIRLPEAFVWATGSSFFSLCKTDGKLRVYQSYFNLDKRSSNFSGQPTVGFDTKWRSWLWLFFFSLEICVFVGHEKRKTVLSRFPKW